MSRFSTAHWPIWARPIVVSLFPAALLSVDGTLGLAGVDDSLIAVAFAFVLAAGIYALGVRVMSRQERLRFGESRLAVIGAIAWTVGACLLAQRLEAVVPPEASKKRSSTMCCEVGRLPSAAFALAR